jgi:hypothetical protein
LHPRYKLKYFEAASWDEEWITAARTIVVDEFERLYAPIEVPDDSDPLYALRASKLLVLLCFTIDIISTVCTAIHVEQYFR